MSPASTVTFAVSMLQRAAAGHRVAGVDGEIDEDLFDLAGVGEDRPQVGGQVGAQHDVLTDGAVEQLLDVGDDVVEVQDPWLDHLAAGEGE